MRALLRSVVVRDLGIVMLMSGLDLLSRFYDRVLVDRAPDYMAGMASGELLPARQSLTDDEALSGFFDNEKVISAASGYTPITITTR